MTTAVLELSSARLKTATKIAVIAAVLLLVVLSWSKELTDLANAQVDAGLKRSLFTFALARGINGLISVVQGSTLSFQPFGIGVTIALGQLLEPVNHLIDEVSTVMLFASAAFGVQKLLLAIGSATPVSIAMTSAALLWSLLFALGRAPFWLSRLLTLLFFIRFVMPVATIGSGYVFDYFSASDYKESTAALEQVSVQLTALSKDVLKTSSEQKPQPQAAPQLQPQAPVPSPSATPPVEAKGLFAKATGGLKEALSTIGTAAVSVKDKIGNVVDISAEQMRGKYESIKSAAEKAVERLITLTVIFIAQTVIIPTALLFVTYRLSLGIIVRER